MKPILRRAGLTWVPVNQEAMDDLLGTEDGQNVIYQPVQRPRNIKQLRMFWALMDIMAENDDAYVDRYAARDDVFRELEQRTGGKGQFMESRVDRWGQTRDKPVSIAFESMEQDKFNPIFNRCLDIVCEWIGTQRKELEDHVWSIINPVKGYQGR